VKNENLDLHILSNNKTGAFVVVGENTNNGGKSECCAIFYACYILHGCF